MTIAHPQLLTKNGNLAITAISDKNRALCWPDHYGGIIALIDEALSDMLVDVQLTIVAEIYCKIFAIKLTRGPKKELRLLLSEEKLSICGSLRGSILGVP